MDRIEVIGLRRSGNHAVIQWIKKHMDKAMCIHWNDVPRSMLLPSGRGITEHQGTGEGELQIANTEDMMYNEALEVLSRAHALWTADLLCKTARLIVLRDPLNLAASRKRYNRTRGNKLFYEDGTTAGSYFLDDWRDTYLNHCAAAMVKDSTAERVPVIYNAWVISESYRKELGERLGLLPSCIEALQSVSEHGEGSSFDGTTFDGKGSEMNVFNRWKEEQAEIEASYLDVFSVVTDREAGPFLSNEIRKSLA